MRSAIERVIEQAKQLTPLEKMRLIEAISPDIEQALSQTDLKPRRSLWGICANLGQVPTVEDIGEIRQEMGLTFY